MLPTWFHCGELLQGVTMLILFLEGRWIGTGDQQDSIVVNCYKV